ncbi:MAG: Fic family protein [Myxococcales bacterium]|nr:Fic family protein [Myxococcales bacterium]
MVEQRLRELDNKLEGLSRRWPVADPQAFLSFQDKLTTLWLYHDHALEGIALSGEDISDALTEKTFPERTRDALCKSIRDHKLTIDFVKQQGLLHAGQVRGLVTVPLLRKLHESLTPSEKGEGHPFRSDRVLHRLYHHPIIPAGQIAASLRKLCESIDEEREAHQHPLLRAVAAHFELMTIYPWPDHNGQVARLLMNLLLLADGYPPAIIRGVERLRYHESLRAGSESLIELVFDSLHSYCAVAAQFLDSQPAEITPKRGKLHAS